MMLAIILISYLSPRILGRTYIKTRGNWYGWRLSVVCCFTEGVVTVKRMLMAILSQPYKCLLIESLCCYCYCYIRLFLLQHLYFHVWSWELFSHMLVVLWYVVFHPVVCIVQFIWLSVYSELFLVLSVPSQWKHVSGAFICFGCTVPLTTVSSIELLVYSVAGGCVWSISFTIVMMHTASLAIMYSPTSLALLLMSWHVWLCVLCWAPHHCSVALWSCLMKIGAVYLASCFGNFEITGSKNEVFF